MSSNPSPLLEILACPSCGAAALVQADDHFACTECSVIFPLLGAIPWLLPHPEAVLHDWRLRTARLLGRLETIAAAIDAELADTSLPAIARSRMKLMAAARRDHARRLGALLAPLDAQRVRMAEAMHAAFATALPMSQDLASYYVNVHRDWAWGEEENRLGCELVLEALNGRRPQRVLVLGAGAGRLAYDLHARLAPRLTVAADHNPLFMLLAERLYRGGSTELYEFPIAPRALEMEAVLRRLAAPAACGTGLATVCADAAAPPFREASFDAVVTPWLIDVMEIDPTAFLPILNRVLVPGGAWVNTGSLVFARREFARRYSIDEVMQQVAANGFEQEWLDEREIPYMRSPASRHARLESVVTWRAVKTADALRTTAAPRGQRWLEDESQPIERPEGTELAAVTARIHGFVLSLIDGRRSIDEIVELLVEQRLMTREDARAAIRNFLTRFAADAARPNWD
jgi:SAM-dependent methyltransferase/uncharacterized protein YbaR (Trm112 family)